MSINTTNKQSNKLHPKFQKMTSRGQVTLPAKWREQYGDFDQVIMYPRKGGFFVQPIPYVEDEREDDNWESFIDFTEGGTKEGMPVQEFIKILEQVKEERNGE